MKHALYLGSVVVFFGALVFFSGCATTGSAFPGEESSSEVTDIDELLGLKSADETEAGESDTIAEDDVLRLLGVVEEAEPQTQTAMPPVTETDPNLNEVVQNMENENAALATREAALREEAVQQEAAISEMRKETPSWRNSSFHDRYQEARQDYTAHQYRDAVQKFEGLLATNSQHSLSDNCQYWIGESYYGLGNFQQAVVAFEKVFTYPESNKDADAQLKLGLCYMKMNDKERAAREFQKLIDNYPTSEYVSVAQRFLQKVR